MALRSQKIAPRNPWSRFLGTKSALTTQWSFEVSKHLARCRRWSAKHRYEFYLMRTPLCLYLGGPWIWLFPRVLRCGNNSSIRHLIAIPALFYSFAQDCPLSNITESDNLPRDAIITQCTRCSTCMKARLSASACTRPIRSWPRVPTSWILPAVILKVSYFTLRLHLWGTTHRPVRRYGPDPSNCCPHLIFTI